VEISVTDEAGNAVRGTVYADGVDVGSAPGQVVVPLCTKELKVEAVDGLVWTGTEKLREGAYVTLPVVVKSRIKGRESPESSLILQPAFSKAGGRLAVLEITAVELKPQILVQISDGLREGALDTIRSAHAGITMMTRESMLMNFNDMGIDPSFIQGECEVETARHIGADYVISATLLKLEGVWILSAKLHESEGGDLLATESVEAKGLLELIRATSGIARALLAKGLGL
jgi:hypothetical protein